MRVRYCYEGNYPRHHADGIVLRHNFTQGTPVKISFVIGSQHAPPVATTDLILVNDMPNYGGPDPVGDLYNCGNTLDVLPDIPDDHQLIANYPPSAVPAAGWALKTITIVPQSNFNQLWIRPSTLPQTVNAELDTRVFVDEFCIETCPPVEYAVSACQNTEQGTVNVTIEGGGKISPGQWTLFQALNCANGTKLPNRGAAVLLNWLPAGNSFTLPLNFGCYILVGQPQVPGCDPQNVNFMINTHPGGLPVCGSACDVEECLQIECKECTLVKVNFANHTYQIVPVTAPRTICFPAGLKIASYSFMPCIPGDAGQETGSATHLEPTNPAVNRQ